MTLSYSTQIIVKNKTEIEIVCIVVSVVHLIISEPRRRDTLGSLPSSAETCGELNNEYGNLVRLSCALL